MRSWGNSILKSLFSVDHNPASLRYRIEEVPSRVQYQKGKPNCFPQFSTRFSYKCAGNMLVYLMKSMFWTNEKLSLIVAWSSSVSIPCSKIQSSEGSSWCPCGSAHEIHELSEWSDILSWDLEHNLPQVEVISIVGCSAFTELSPSLGSFIELWNISFGFLSILSPSDENIDLRQAFQFHILMTPNKRNLKTILSMQWFVYIGIFQIFDSIMKALDSN